ncbi:GntR family transcriptional regulator [Bosea sp. NPDC003192]|uniref:GntR family transcriptional regulator n=1 Tax=Bosea sp. NPDC003192 TaxID=3390551 RepID=UPI003CFD73FE
MQAFTAFPKEELVPDEMPATLHDRLVGQLRAIFLDGELPEGTRIPEVALSERFGVSRTPLREALKVMAAEGFVILRPNRGAVVAPIDPTEIAPLVEFKGALERLIGLLVPARASEVDIAELEGLHRNLGEALMRQDHAAYTRINYAFHQRLAQAARNPVLTQNYEAVQQKIWRYRFTINELSERLAASYAEHEGIMVALRARTRLDLAERLEEHNRLTGEAMAQALATSGRFGPSQRKSRRRNRSA